MLYDVSDFPFGSSILFGVLRGDVPRFWLFSKIPVRDTKSSTMFGSLFDCLSIPFASSTEFRPQEGFCQWHGYESELVSSVIYSSLDFGGDNATCYNPVSYAVPCLLDCRLHYLCLM